jgi:hypothetical protein
MKAWREMTTQERSEYKKAKKAEREAGRQAMADYNTEVAAEDAEASADDPAEPTLEMRPWEEDEFPEADDDSEDRELLDAPVAEALDEPEPEAPLDRETLLAAIDPDLRAALDDDDIRQILAEEEKRAADARKKKAMDKAREQIRHRMQVEHGLLDAATLRTREQNQRLAKKIQIRFMLPADGSGDPGRGANGFRIDGRMFESGQWHTVTMAEFESLQRNFYDIIVNETQFSTLDQSRRAGITSNNRLQGTTAARALVARAPTMIETRDADDARLH